MVEAKYWFVKLGSNLQRDVRNALQSFKGKSVLVIGDVMLDEFFTGPTTRLAPEAPAPVISVKEHYFELGGAANLAHNVRSLGGSARLAGVVGLDQFGLELRALLSRKGIDAEGVETDGDRQTTIKTRVKSDGRLLVRYDREQEDIVEGDVEDRLLRFLRNAIPKADAVAVSDYGKGVLSAKVTAQIQQSCREHATPLVIDSKSFMNLGLRGATILKANYKHLARETNLEIDPTDNSKCEKAAKTLLEQLKPKNVILTRSGHGMTLLESNGKFLHLPSTSKVVDVNGAGDTVMAMLALTTALQTPMQLATIMANAAAGIVVGKNGTAAANPAELESALKNARY